MSEKFKEELKGIRLYVISIILLILDAFIVTNLMVFAICLYVALPEIQINGVPTILKYIMYAPVALICFSSFGWMPYLLFDKIFVKWYNNK